jgi:3-hydroxybutyryl-CoA dehydratase
MIAELEVFDDTPIRRLTIDEVRLGESVFQRVRFDRDMLNAFGRIASDRAPVHDDPRFARSAGFADPIVQGFALATRFSRLIGMYLPGEHAILESVELKFRQPVYAEREVVYRASVERIFRPMRVVQLRLSIALEGVERVTGVARTVIR